MFTPGLYFAESPRDVLVLTGRDRASFLQGMVTNDVLSLEPGQGCYAFHLDATGHVLADMYVLVQEDRILLDLEPGVGPVLAELLDHYLVMERVKIAPLLQTCFFVGTIQATSSALVPCDDPEGSHEPFLSGFVAAEKLGAMIFVDPGKESAILEYLKENVAIELELSALDALRIFTGVPRFGVDIDKRVLAPETGQAARAIHYKKGCYVGQEIVARIDARGHTNRALAGFWLSEPVPAETPVTVGGKEVGRITSSAAWEGRAVALGYLRNEFSTPGTEILAGNASGTVRELS